MSILSANVLLFQGLDQTMDCTLMSPPVQRAMAYIKEHFDRPISVMEVAEHVALSYHHLCRKFRKETGMTVIELISHLRIEKAKKLLMTTPEPVNEIARQVGFTSTVQFHRTFRKQTDDTPMQFRKKAFGEG